MQVAIIALSAIAIVAIAAAATTGVFCFRFVLDSANKVFQNASQLAQQEGKYAVSTVQVSQSIADQVDRKVSERVQLVNRVANANGQGPAPSKGVSLPIEEPPLPGISQTGMIDDLHEITRDVLRFRRENDEYDAPQAREAYQEV